MRRFIPCFFSALLLTVLGHSALAQAVSGRLSGLVTDALNQPLGYATVGVRGTTLGATTSEAGRFALDNLPVGTYTLHVTSIGYTPLDQAVVVGAGQHLTLTLRLEATTTALQSVEITGRKERDYKNTVTFAGTKTATPIKEVPQSIAYVTKELVQDQGAARIGDVVKNVSGVNQYTAYDDLTIRGFRNQSNSSAQLFNGLRTFSGYWRQPLINYLERVEIIKGPASALYGNAAPGGTVNKVTKKPLNEDRKAVSFSLGSFDTFRALTDFTGPANQDSTLLYRLNLGYENAKSFRDLQFDKNVVVAPSVSFLPNAKTRLNLDAVYNKSQSRLDRGQAIYGNKDLYSTPISQSIAEVNDYLNEETYMVTASLSHQFTDRVSFNASFLRTGYNQDLLEHRGSNAYAKDRLGKDITTLAERQVNYRHNEQYNNSATAYLTLDADAGPTHHRILVGYDYADSQIPVGSSQSNAAGYRLKDGTVASKYVVKDSAKYLFYSYNGQKIPQPNVPAYDLTTNKHILQDVSKYVYSAANNGVTIPVFSNLNGVYVQDQLTFRRLQLLLGLRYDHYTDRLNWGTATESKVNQDVLLPRVGAVYTINEHVNAYGTYTKGYNPQDAATQANTATGGPFAPIRSNLVEAGFKSDWLHKRLSISTAVYRITQTNTLYPAGVAGQPELLVQIGREVAKGVELDVVGQLARNWSIVATYAYNNAQITGARNSTDTLLLGQQKPNAPKHQGSIWTKYEFADGPLQGFGVGLGGQYVADRRFGFQGIIAGQTGPAYTLVSSALYYRVNKVQIQLNVNNLTGKTYWVGGYDNFRLYPGAPRNWLTTVSYVF